MHASTYVCELDEPIAVLRTVVVIMKFKHPIRHHHPRVAIHEGSDGRGEPPLPRSPPPGTKKPLRDASKRSKNNSFAFVSSVGATFPARVGTIHPFRDRLPWVHRACPSPTLDKIEALITGGSAAHSLHLRTPVKIITRSPDCQADERSGPPFISRASLVIR